MLRAAGPSHERLISARSNPRMRTRLGGPTGNERLTAMTGVVLIVLLAVEGVTVLFLRPLLSTHIFVGMLLVPPVALKLASTGYRFARYYAGSRAFVEKGPPSPLLRLLAPLVVASTLGLFASGVALIVLGPGTRFILTLHQASFIAWLAATGAHVLGHVLRISRPATADLRKRERVPGSALRASLLAGSLVAGTTLAIATLPLASAWLQWRGEG